MHRLPARTQCWEHQLEPESSPRSKSALVVGMLAGCAALAGVSGTLFLDRSLVWGTIVPIDWAVAAAAADCLRSPAAPYLCRRIRGLPAANATDGHFRPDRLRRDLARIFPHAG